jgi:hypothetical protein
MSERFVDSAIMLDALMELDREFALEHERLYAEHARAAKAKDGLFCKIFEAAMGAHDRAWATMVSVMPFELHQKVLKEIYDRAPKK